MWDMLVWYYVWSSVEGRGHLLRGVVICGGAWSSVEGRGHLLRGVVIC